MINFIKILLIIATTLIICWFLAPYAGDPSYYIIKNPNYQK